MREHVVLERADRLVVPVDDRVVDRLRLRRLGGQLPALGDPLRPAAVEDPHVRVAEQAEHPQRVGGPPVVAVAVEDDGGLAGDPALAAEPREARAVHVVAGHGVVQLGVPVDLDGTGDVPDVVEQHVFVRLDDDEPWLAEVFGQPGRGDEPLGVRVRGELGGGIVRERHDDEVNLAHRQVQVHQSVTRTPTPASSRRVSGRLIPMTLDGSPSMPSTNQPPSPSRVNAPATTSGSPVAR